MSAEGTVPRQTARRMVREAIRRDLVPGDRLASEPALMSYFDVSRGSLREALRLLSFLGVIDIRSGPGGGARMAMPQPRVVGSALAIALQLRGATLRTVLEARAALEPTLAGLAATHRNDQNLLALDTCLTRLARASDSATFTRGDAYFHQLLAEAAGNDALALIASALTMISGSLGWEHPEATQERVLEEKRAIGRAVQARDAEAAASWTSTYFTNLFTELGQHQPDLLATRLAWPDVDEMADLEF